MCPAIILFVIQVLTLQVITAYPFNDYIVAYIPVEELAYLSSPKRDSNILVYVDPRDLRGMLVEEISSPYVPSRTGSFGGPVKATGTVSMVGDYGYQGTGSYISYSSPASSIVVTTVPEAISATPTTTPFISSATLPEFTEVVPSVSMPSSIVPVSTATATATSSVAETTSIESSGVTVSSEVDVATTSTSSVSNTVRDANVPVTQTQTFGGSVPVTQTFGGLVPAAGNVRIYAHFS